MSYYGYPIDPEELEKAKQKEKEKREKKEQKKLQVKDIEGIDNIENSNIEEFLDDNIENFEEEIVDNETVNVDCSRCTQKPSNCDKNCLANLDKDYLKTLLEDEENDDEENSKEQILEKMRKKALCLEPTFLEKLKTDLSSEDFSFIKKEMIWYSVIFFVTYISGFLLVLLSLKFNIMFLLSLALLILFSSNITNFYLKGKYWNYIRKSTKSRKNPVPYETIIKEIPKYRINNLSIPKKKMPFIIYGFIIILSILVLFIS